MSSRISCVLGFDYGHKKIGVAVGQSVTGTASALETIATQDLNAALQRIGKLISEWRPNALVVGHPLTLDGKEQPASRAARSFATRLELEFGVPTTLYDERLTTQEARKQFKTMRGAGTARKGDAGQIDALAARLIVESWLAQNLDSADG